MNNKKQQSNAYYQLAETDGNNQTVINQFNCDEIDKKQRQSQRQSRRSYDEFENNDDYFYQLKEYNPVPCGPIFLRECQGQPLFLINSGWWKSFIVMFGFNILFGLTLVTFVVDDTEHPTTTNTGKGRQHVLKIICIVTLSITNIFYLLTQFMNPGIINPVDISQEEFDKNGRAFCENCQAYRTEKMIHCSECDVCIWGYDHHCGFFGKCIGGWQKYAFYVFLVGMFGTFMVLLASMSWELGI